MEHRRYVAVPVTTLWTTPQSPGALDADAVADLPDVPRWLAALDAAGARGALHGRVDSQLLAGEPVDVVGTAGGGWVQVTCPWQPSARDARGYPGWLRAAHLAPAPPVAAGPAPRPLQPADRSGRPLPGPWQDVVGVARRHLGLPYLWGGLSGLGLDCSGLVHLAMRELGIIVPRDADDQHDACVPLPVDEAWPGDLLFFARAGERPHHVAVVTGPGRVLHAPETGRVVTEEPLPPARLATLSGAGRFPAAAPVAL